MERELREFLRVGAAGPDDDLDLDDLRERVRRVRRRRRLRTAGVLLVAVVAAGVPAALVGTRATPVPNVMVEPAPTSSGPPEGTASPRGSERPWAACPGGARFNAGWLPQEFSLELEPGPGGRGSYPHAVAHYDGGPGRYVELHFGPLPSTPTATGAAHLLGQEAQLGAVKGGYVVAFDEPHGRDRCGLVGLYATGIGRREAFGVAENLSLRPPIRGPDEVAVPVRAAELVEHVGGWAATDDGLYWTLGGGGSWIDVSPEGIDPQELRGTTFIDRIHGWIVDLPGEQGGQAQVLRTTDGGNSWRSSAVDLPAPPAGAYGEVVIEFVDPQHGWLLVGLPGGMSSETGELFATIDGGRSWRRLATVPVAQDLSFSSLTDGWLTGGAPSGGPVKLYVTRDGGRSWQEAPIPVPEGWQDARAVTTVPLGWSAEEAALAVGLSEYKDDVRWDEDRGAIAVFETADAGRTWQLAKLAEVPATAGCCGAPPFDLTGRGSWIAASPDGSTVLIPGNDRPVYRGLPSPLMSLSSGDSSNPGWVLTLTGTRCASGPDACLALLAEQNGEWVALEPGRGPQPAACVRDATRRNAPPDRDPATLDVYFICGDDQVAIPPAVYRHTRPAPVDADSLDERIAATVSSWLRGPTTDERAAGYGNGLPGLGPDLLRGVDVADGTVTVDLREQLRMVNNLSTSHAGSYFHREIAAIVFGADDAIERVRFTLDGSCQAFSAIFEADPCQVRKRPEFADLLDT